ncbi:MAG: rod shape-determining protein MreD [Clostridiales Family XIII bacterium]|jgi:rod shape-determining protein MreD|nr:rod shape-determining protein MreD [Clostridiales Family XIII bacterium]
MSYKLAVPLFFIALILQTTVLNKIAIYGYAPNLLLCMVVVFSFLYQRLYGLVLGAIFGILLDLVTKPIVGIESLTFLVTFIIASALSEYFNHEKLLPDLVTGVIATVLSVGIKYLLYLLVGYTVNLSVCLESLKVLIPYNLVVIAILHLVFVRSIIRFYNDRKFQGGYWTE